MHDLGSGTTPSKIIVSSMNLLEAVFFYAFALPILPHISLLSSATREISVLHVCINGNKSDGWKMSAKFV